MKKSWHTHPFTDNNNNHFFVIHLYWGTQQMGIMGKWRCPFIFWNKKVLCYCGQLVPGGLCKYCDQFKEASKFKRNCNNNLLARRARSSKRLCVWVCACLFGEWAEGFLPVKSQNCCCWCCCQSWLIFSLIYSQPCWTWESRYTWGSYLHCINLN